MRQMQSAVDLDPTCVTEALDRMHFARMMREHGADTILWWWNEDVRQLVPRQPSVSSISDPRR